MTGFARRERQYPFGLLAWEIRTVNHRFLEIACRVPEELRACETEFRQSIAGAVRRGKVDCSLHFRPAVQAGPIEIDAMLLEALTQRVREIATQAGAAARIDALDLLRWPGVVRNVERDPAPLFAAAQALLAELLVELARARDREGERLREALEQRCAGLVDFAARVVERLPEVRARLRAKLSERVAQLCEVDSERLEQELALLALKLDVDEELDRLRGHITEVRSALDGQEPAGRRLDFLMQELNREANTLSSKSQDIETTRAAVDMKVLIEQMREQVQNIE